MRYLYILLDAIVSACRYDVETDSYVRCDVQCMRRATAGCRDCFFSDGDACNRIACMSQERPDGENVYFKQLKRGGEE